MCACPHCGVYGSLNAHGALIGYREDGAIGTFRGLRFFCSNRFLRPGCGRTCSVQLAHFMKHFVVTTATLWQFAQLVVRGLSLAAAWLKAARGHFSRSTGYRLWRRLCGALPALQTLLLQLGAVPACAHHLPIAQMLAHARAVFPVSESPFADFQLKFQTQLLL
jgi:hypothetical protein